MRTIEFTSKQNNSGYFQVNIIIDGENAGRIELGGEEIMYSEIEEEFRGKSLYKSLLIAAINLSGKNILYSFNRNEYSNPAYAKWTGDENLSENETCGICIDGENLQIFKMSEM